MILISRRHDGAGKCKLRHCCLISENAFHLCSLRAKGIRIGARRSEAQIDQLEHRLQIFARAAAVQALFELADEWSGRRDFAGHQLAQIDRAEFADASGRESLRCRAGRNVILVARERAAAGTGRAK